MSDSGGPQGPLTEAQLREAPQNLPLPVGGFQPQHRNRRPRLALKLWRFYAPPSVGGIGILAALAGIALAFLQTPVPVYSYGGNVQVGTATLVYDGSAWIGDAAVVVNTQQSGVVIAGASTQAGGKNVAGRCRMIRASAAEMSETCDFWIGVSSTGTPNLKSSDTYDLSHNGPWLRHYSDGQDVRIGVPLQAGLLPVPLPIGR